MLSVKSPIFIERHNIVLPRTNIKYVQNTPESSGIMLYIDREWAYYKNIAPLVFVRKSRNDSIKITPSNTLLKSFSFDLNGDGRFERITFERGTLLITSGKDVLNKFNNVKSFVFYDVDNNGSLDLLYTDSQNNLHFLKNKGRIPDHAIIKSAKEYELVYIKGKKKYQVKINPYIFSGVIPLYGFDKVYIVYNGTKFPLKKGSMINTHEINSPIKYATFKDDTLKLSLKFIEKTTYSIYLKSEDKTIKIADGTLPEGTYNFDYLVGKMEKGKYILLLKTNDNEFTKNVIVK